MPEDRIPPEDRRIPPNDAVCAACGQRYCAGCSYILHKPHLPQCPARRRD